MFSVVESVRDPVSSSVALSRNCRDAGKTFVSSGVPSPTVAILSV